MFNLGYVVGFLWHYGKRPLFLTLSLGGSERWGLPKGMKVASDNKQSLAILLPPYLEVSLEVLIIYCYLTNYSKFDALRQQLLFFLSVDLCGSDMGGRTSWAAVCSMQCHLRGSAGSWYSCFQGDSLIQLASWGWLEIRNSVKPWAGEPQFLWGLSPRMAF